MKLVSEFHFPLIRSHRVSFIVTHAFGSKIVRFTPPHSERKSETFLVMIGSRGIFRDIQKIWRRESHPFDSRTSSLLLPSNELQIDKFISGSYTINNVIFVHDVATIHNRTNGPIEIKDLPDQLRRHHAYQIIGT